MMDGLIRYTVEDALTQQGLQTLEGPGLWIRAADFDEHQVQVKQREEALHQRLTAADERADSLEAGLKWESDRNALLLASLTEAEDMLSVSSLEAGQRIEDLEGLLLQTNELLYAIQGDPGAVPSSAIDAMRGEVFTALKPAEGGGDDA